MAFFYRMYVLVGWESTLPEVADQADFALGFAVGELEISLST